MEEIINKTVRDDLLLFKNDTLKDIKQSEKNLLEKFRNTEFELMKNIENHEKKFNKFVLKIDEIVNFIDSIKDIKNQINTLFTFKTKTENSLIDLDIKLRSFEKETRDSIYSINNILKDSVLYPGVIGKTSKFKKFHNFIDYVLLSITHGKQFKEKITKEVTDNRIRQDNNIEKLKANYDILIEKTKSLIDNEIVQLEERNKNEFNSIEEKITNLRLHNAKNDMSIKDIEEIINNVNQQIKEIDNKENELFQNYNKLNENNNKNNEEIISLKDKYYSLSNYVNTFNNNSNNYNYNYNKNNIEKNSYISKRNNTIEDDENKLSFKEDINTKNKALIKTKLKHNRMSLKDYINGHISINELQNSNKGNYKSVTTLKTLDSEEDDNNKKRYTSIEDKINPNLNNIQIYNTYSNSNTLRYKNKNKESEKFFKINNITSLCDKSSDINLNNKKLGNISLNIEGNEILNFKLNNSNNNNKKYNDIIQNVKNILHKNNNYISGFPRIITNQGERIIFSSHPVYRRDKFSKKINPKLFSLNKSIKKLYGNKK